MDTPLISLQASWTIDDDEDKGYPKLTFGGIRVLWLLYTKKKRNLITSDIKNPKYSMRYYQGFLKVIYTVELVGI